MQAKCKETQDVVFKSTYLEDFFNALDITGEGLLQQKKRKKCEFVSVLPTDTGQINSANICSPLVL